MVRALLLLIALGLPLAACDPASTSEPPVEPTRFRIEITNVAQTYSVLKTGVVRRPVGSSIQLPYLEPGRSFEFSFNAGPNVTPGSGMRLSLATQFRASNDLFYAFEPDGLALYDAAGNARTGDMTSEIRFYDAGTEVNEEPGLGPNQPRRQTTVDAGMDENGVIGEIPDGTAGRSGFSYPDIAEVIRVTIDHDGETEFTVRVTNMTDENTLITSEGRSGWVFLSQFAWIVHGDEVDPFMLGEAAPDWLEALAEVGNATDAPWSQLKGVTFPLSPGVVVVHESDVRFYERAGAATAGMEALAEDGNPSPLVAEVAGAEGIVSATAFTTPAGSGTPGLLWPGESYAVEVEGRPGDRISLATMFIQSNDLFFTFEQEGLPLFSDTDVPLSGPVQSQIRLYDAGTELNEEPGVGLNQPFRQSATDTGAEQDSDFIAIRSTLPGPSGFVYPLPPEVIHVTVTPLN